MVSGRPHITACELSWVRRRLQLQQTQPRALPPRVCGLSNADDAGLILPQEYSGEKRVQPLTESSPPSPQRFLPFAASTFTRLVGSMSVSLASVRPRIFALVSSVIAG